MSSRSTRPLSPDDTRFLEDIASFHLSPKEEQRSTPPLSPEDRRFLEDIASLHLSPEEEKRIWEEEKARRNNFYLPASPPFMHDTILRLKMGAMDPLNTSSALNVSKRLVERIIENHDRLEEAFNARTTPSRMHVRKHPLAYHPYAISRDGLTALNMDTRA